MASRRLLVTVLRSRRRFYRLLVSYTTLARSAAQRRLLQTTLTIYGQRRCEIVHKNRGSHLKNSARTPRALADSPERLGQGTRVAQSRRGEPPPRFSVNAAGRDHRTPPTRRPDKHHGEQPKHRHLVLVPRNTSGQPHVSHGERRDDRGLCAGPRLAVLTVLQLLFNIS